MEIIILSHCVLYVVHGEIFRTFYLGYFFFAVKIHYLMSYSIWLCSKMIISFSTWQIFHFWNKVCEKKGKFFFVSLCAILPYSILDFENRKHIEFQFSHYVSFQNINFYMKILKYSMRIKFWRRYILKFSVEVSSRV